LWYWYETGKEVKEEGGRGTTPWGHGTRTEPSLVTVSGGIVDPGVWSKAGIYCTGVWGTAYPGMVEGGTRGPEKEADTPSGSPKPGCRTTLALAGASLPAR
jgi:hypothetical protein